MHMQSNWEMMLFLFLTFVPVYHLCSQYITCTLRILLVLPVYHFYSQYTTCTLSILLVLSVYYLYSQCLYSQCIICIQYIYKYIKAPLLVLNSLDDTTQILKLFGLQCLPPNYTSRKRMLSTSLKK